MHQSVLGAESRQAVHVELDAAPDAERFRVEGAVLGAGRDRVLEQREAAAGLLGRRGSAAESP
jgi:hypothetical protein